MPADFWSLTVREFQLKHAAFARSEDRHRSLMLELVGFTASLKKQDRAALQRTVHGLRRYPVKPWMRA